MSAKFMLCVYCYHVGHTYEVKLQVNMVMANQISQDTVYKVSIWLLSLSLTLPPPN